MSRQDADDQKTAEDSADGTTDREGTDESLEDIAAEPADDIETVLADILDPEAESPLAGESMAGEEVDIDDDLVETVEEHSAEELARVIKTLQTERTELRSELEAERERAEDLESRLKRKQADFQNYKKRQKERMEEEKQRATEDFTERLLDVRDNLARALDQDESVDIRDGVETTLDQFDGELERENVAVIEPDPGSEVDPQRHEVLIRIESDQPADTVAELHRPGYEMAGKVLRPAQVAVSDGSGDDSEASDSGK